LPRGTVNLPSANPENKIERGKEEIKRKKEKKGKEKENAHIHYSI
jgi:hypothetical protein